MSHKIKRDRKRREKENRILMLEALRGPKPLTRFEEFMKRFKEYLEEIEKNLKEKGIIN